MCTLKINCTVKGDRLQLIVPLVTNERECKKLLCNKSSHYKKSGHSDFPDRTGPNTIRRASVIEHFSKHACMHKTTLTSLIYHKSTPCIVSKKNGSKMEDKGKSMICVWEWWKAHLRVKQYPIVKKIKPTALLKSCAWLNTSVS